LNHRRPAIPFTDAPRGTCRWCGEPILHESGAKRGSLNRRRRWHPTCVAAYNATDPRELRRRVRRRDRGVCALCRLNTYELRRSFKGRGMWARMREKGFVPRRSLWELDHKVPLIDGGTHSLSNLQTLCVPCHHDKSAREHSERAAQNRKRGSSASAGDGPRS
jgi:5-methylcytosine-specific restriction endonuclease McrA